MHYIHIQSIVNYKLTEVKYLKWTLSACIWGEIQKQRALSSL